MKKKVYVDARTNIPYGSFYLKGLVDMFGRMNVIFDSKRFAGLAALGRDIRFIVKEGDEVKKYFIHTNDSYKINLDHYNWCDVYGNVNANFKFYPIDNYPKQVSLVPSFGIRNFNLFETLCFSINNFFRTIQDIKNWEIYNKFSEQYEKNTYKNFRRHFLNYLKNYLNRLPIESYINKNSINKNYIFFLSTLWYSDAYNKNDETVNLRRANFIEVCKEIDICNFEGGLFADSSSSTGFEKSRTNIRLELSDWIIKTKESVLVFNTPAFWDCHGWKLGEYLALGKAIISTPLSNDLPEPLIHAKHIHIISDASKESIREAIIFILENPEYRKSLEFNAQKYWNEYGTPEKALNLLGLFKPV
ncbi:MAG: hypothetical protein PHS59_05800 [Paludibacter sp.]|nr:hypothetical protein [Paludibacter sp.]